MNPIPFRAWGPTGLIVGATGLLLSATVGGCLAIADVGHIEYAEPSCTDGLMNGDETGIDCGGATCEPCTESCTNGIDDDGDGLIDCADEGCTDFGCAPAAPDGWSGPVALFAGSDDATLPQCAAGWPNRSEGGSGTLSAPPARCTPCTCEDPTGASCAGPTLTFFGSGDCTGSVTVSHTMEEAPGSCEGYGSTGSDSVLASPLPVSGGSCTPDGGAATVDPEAWTARHVICEGTEVGAGCTNAAHVCIRTPEAPFQTALCVSQPGDVSCPVQDYTEKTLIYTGLTDDRRCEPCSCDDPAGMSCEGTTTVYSNASCSMSAEVVPNDGTTCTASFNMSSARYSVDGAPTGGSCDASGGAPTGDAAPADPLTVCCLPE